MQNPHSDESIPLETGQGGLPKIVLTANDGDRVEIYLHGAHVTSWIPAGGDERLYLSPKAEFHEHASIRGGVPVIFPQFGVLGPLGKHGFVRNQAWTLIECKNNRAVLSLQENEETLQAWPHPFQAVYSVEAVAQALFMTLTISNTGSQPFAFTAALHTYLRVEDVQHARVEQLKGKRFVDAAGGWTEWIEKRERVDFPALVDRIYYDAGSARLVTPQRRTQVESTGFKDIVVWNPGKETGAKLDDLEPDGYRRFVCIESVAAGQPVQLGPGESWQGSQSIR